MGENYIKQIFKLNMRKNKKAMINIFGCRMNYFDLQKMCDIILKMDYEITNDHNGLFSNK